MEENFKKVACAVAIILGGLAGVTVLGGSLLMLGKIAQLAKLEKADEHRVKQKQAMDSWIAEFNERSKQPGVQFNTKTEKFLHLHGGIDTVEQRCELAHEHFRQTIHGEIPEATFADLEDARRQFDALCTPPRP